MFLRRRLATKPDRSPVPVDYLGGSQEVVDVGIRLAQVFKDGDCGAGGVGWGTVPRKPATKTSEGVLFLIRERWYRVLRWELSSQRGDAGVQKLSEEGRNDVNRVPPPIPPPP